MNLLVVVPSSRETRRQPNCISSESYMIYLHISLALSLRLVSRIGVLTVFASSLPLPILGRDPSDHGL